MMLSILFETVNDDIDNDEEDILDNKFWGSDDEDDENDDSDINDADYDGGDEITESQLVAKEENQGLKEDEKNNDKQKRKENLNDEINDLDEMQNDEYDGEHIDPYKEQDKKQDLENKDSIQELPEDLNLDQSDVDENEEKMSISESVDMNDSETNEVEDELEDKEIKDEQDDKEQDNKEQEENELEQSNDNDEEVELNKEETDENLDENKTDNFVPDNLPSNDLAFASEFDKTACADNVEKENLLNNQTSSESVNNSANNENQFGTAKGAVNETNNFGEQGELITSLNKNQVDKEFQNKPAQKDKSRRALSDGKETKAKRQKIFDSNDSSLLKAQPEKIQNDALDSMMYQHVEDETQANNEVCDLANDEQGQKNKYTEDNCNENDNLPDEPEKMEEEQEQKEFSEQVNPITLNKAKSSYNSQKIEEKDKNINENEKIEIDGETVSTSFVTRGPKSTYHTQFIQNETNSNFNLEFDCKIDIKSLSLNDDCLEIWKQCEFKVTPLVYELCEQLQLVLEPTKTGKLKGDYRNGKRLNMRKIIAYIASQFRKDKIWLRRTKPSKRQYQIILAFDDSLSMDDNQSKQLAFESLALLGKSLSLLEAGELGIMSFGEVVKLLHPFNEPFTDLAGAKILNQFKFNQNQTRIGELLKASIQLFSTSKRIKGPVREISQLLLIVSDGRGMFSEGEDSIKQTIRIIRDLGIFMVFVILDDPRNKDSILDIRVPVFDQSGNLKIETYMEKFPFPYYIILRDISSMPLILGEALRQWFELISSTER